MDRNSINLFKKRFLDFNRVRYKENITWFKALNTLTPDDINVLDYVPDPENTDRFVSTEVKSAKFDLTGLDQRYTKAYFGTDTIAVLSDRTIYPDLVSILNLNIKGIFFYENKEEPEYPHVVITTNFLYEWDDGIDFINEVMSAINTHARYDVLPREVDIVKDEDDSSGKRIVVNVTLDNPVAWGTIKVGQIPQVYPMGTYPYEYLGKFSEHHLISKDDLLDLANIFDSDLDEKARLKDPLVWLKFRYYGRIVYIPKYPILTRMTWDKLNERGMTGGRTVITAGDGEEYRLRLLTISDSEGDDEWTNLMKRCIKDTDMTVWETFDYAKEMQYSANIASTLFASSILTEGVNDEEQNYLVGFHGSADLKASIKKNVEGWRTGNTQYTTGWLPVLELRGSDQIDTASVHPHWVSLRDPIPNQMYAKQTPPEGVVFAIRVAEVELLGGEDPDLSLDASSGDDTGMIVLRKVEDSSSVPEADLLPYPVDEGGVLKVDITKVLSPYSSYEADMDVYGTLESNVLKVDLLTVSNPGERAWGDLHVFGERESDTLKVDVMKWTNPSEHLMPDFVPHNTDQGNVLKVDVYHTSDPTSKYEADLTPGYTPDEEEEIIPPPPEPPEETETPDIPEVTLPINPVITE